MFMNIVSGFLSPSVFLSLTARADSAGREYCCPSYIFFSSSLFLVYSITWEIFIYMCTVGRDIISYIIYCLASPHNWPFAVSAQSR